MFSAVGENDSGHSSLTSVFHELLGDGLAKTIAERSSLVQRTISEGELLISRQHRETRRGDARKFSTSLYRRLGEDEAREALRSVPDLASDAESRLVSAMERVPIWHVVVKGIDKPKVNQPVSIYFLQNLEELRELASTCLIEGLEEDDPSIIQQAVENPIFQDWCRQWYMQSENPSDERSLRYICRMKGCAVLTHCVRNDFGECTEFLLEKHSDRTALEKWLVLAEPLRHFGKFQMNAFMEATYNGSPDALSSLINYGNANLLPWRELKDSEGKTALDLARSQVERGRTGAETCLKMLEREYGVSADQLAPPRVEALAENLLIVSWSGDDGIELGRIRLRLPDISTWADLVRESKNAFLNAPKVPGTPTVMLFKSIISDGAEDDVREFFELWSEATSIGSFKTRIQHPDAPLSICKTLNTLLSRPTAPKWNRIYLFRSFSSIALSQDASVTMAEALRSLAKTLATSPELPLWKLERFPAYMLLVQDRHIVSLLDAALDVKRLVHQLREGKQVYRFFWNRLASVERCMLDRMKLLNQPDLFRLQDAIDPQAVNFLAGCIRLWLSSIRTDNEFSQTWNLDDAQKRDVLEQLDITFCGALSMRGTLPEAPAALMEVLPASELALFPGTAAALAAALEEMQNSQESVYKKANFKSAKQSQETRKQQPDENTATTNLQPVRMTSSRLDKHLLGMAGEYSRSNISRVLATRTSEYAWSGSQRSLSNASDANVSVMSCGEEATGNHCFLFDAIFKIPGDQFVTARDLAEGAHVCGAHGNTLMVKSFLAHHKQKQDLIHIQCRMANLVVTASHRVMVRRAHGPQTLRADAISRGESVLCSNSMIEEVTEVTKFTDEVEVVEVVFDPDEPVEAIMQMAILSKGHGWSKTTRRSRARKNQQIGDTWSFPDTASEVH